MFKKFIDDLTWESRFRKNQRFAEAYILNGIWTRGLEEKLLYWKEWGRRFAKTPEEAIYQAVFEFCEDFRVANLKSPYKDTKKLETMAETLKRLLSAKYEGGRIVMPYEQLSSEWRMYLK